MPRSCVRALEPIIVDISSPLRLGCFPFPLNFFDLESFHTRFPQEFLELTSNKEIA